MEYVGSNVNDSNMRVCECKSNFKWENPPRFLSSSSAEREKQTDTNKKCIQEKGQGCC